MSDPTSAPLQSGTAPAKKSCLKKMLLRFSVLLIVMGVAFVYVHYCSWYLRTHGFMAATNNNAALQAQIAALDRRIQVLEANRTTVQPTAVEVPAPAAAVDTAAFTRLQSDMVAMSSAMAALQTEVKATGATAAEARSTAASVIASAIAYLQLREATANSHAFTNELTVLREAAKNDAALLTAAADIEPYAAVGAPTLATLHTELLEREPAATVAATKAAATTWWQRVLAELQSVISVRPLHGGEGDALAELESATTQNSAAALEAFHQLPPATQNYLQDWKTKLEARQHVDQGMAAMAASFTSRTAANP